MKHQFKAVDLSQLKSGQGCDMNDVRVCFVFSLSLKKPYTTSLNLSRLFGSAVVLSLGDWMNSSFI